MFFGGGIQSRLARIFFVPVRTATKRASGGKSANNRTAGRRLGPKKGEGEFVSAGDIIWRQRGTRFFPGENAGIGRDHTIYAREPGYVRFYRDPFHAKRRFIGIALGHNLRLPTPHFEPRRRRLGFQVIDNPEIAEFEADFLTRKETKRVHALNDIAGARAEKKEKRLSEYREVLPDISEPQLMRLDSIFQFMRGSGLPYNTARDLVDSIAREDINIVSRTGKDSAESAASKLDAYTQDSAVVDAKVCFSPQAKLVPVDALSEEAKKAALAKITALAQPHLDSPEGTPQDVVEQIYAVFAESPAFSESERSQLLKQLLKRPLPIAVTKETKKGFEAEVKKGAGKIQGVWDAKSSKIRQYFVPNGAKLLFV